MARLWLACEFIHDKPITSQKGLVPTEDNQRVAATSNVTLEEQVTYGCSDVSEIQRATWLDGAKQGDDHSSRTGL